MKQEHWAYYRAREIKEQINNVHPWAKDHYEWHFLSRKLFFRSWWYFL